MSAELAARTSAYDLSIDLIDALRRHCLEVVAQARSSIASDAPIEIDVRFGQAMVATRWFPGQGAVEEERAYDEARRLLRGKSAFECVVAVCYPADIVPESFNAAHYMWQVVQLGNGVNSGWAAGNLSQLVFFIRLSLARPRALDVGSQALVDALASGSEEVVAAVLGLVSATNENGREIRKSLNDNYQLAFVISSHDPRRDYFSGSGQQTEVLVICRLLSRDSLEDLPTRIVNLARNPSTPAQAAVVARAIQDGNTDLLKHGAVFDIGTSEVESGDWGGVHFLSPFLSEGYSDLVTGRMFKVVPLEAVASVGTTGSVIRHVFVKAVPGDRQAVGSLWGQGAHVSTMLAEPDTFIVAKHSHRERAQEYWNDRSRLLLTTNFYLATNSVVAVWLQEPTVGSLWNNCRMEYPEPGHPYYEQALCVFLNSTVGILSALGGCTGSGRLIRPRMTVENLQSMKVPDFHSLDPTSVEILVQAFQALCNYSLRTLTDPQQCPTRSAIDDAVSEALGIDRDLVRAVGKALAAEPSVTGNRYDDRLFIQQQLALGALSTENHPQRVEILLSEGPTELGSRGESLLDEEGEQKSLFP